MDKNQMLSEIRGEIKRLQQIESLLVGDMAAQPRTGRQNRTTASPKAVRTPMSAADRERRSKAQKARWARIKGIQNAGKPEGSTESDSHNATKSGAGAPRKAVKKAARKSK